MKKSWAITGCFMVLSLGLCLAAFGAEEPAFWEIEPLSPEGEVEYDFLTQTITYTNGAVVRYGDTTLTAQKVSLNQETGEALAEGAVSIRRQGQWWSGEKITYNLKTGQMTTDAFRTGQSPIFAGGKELKADRTNDIYYARDAFITTDDYSHPAERVRARSLKIVPGKYFEARHATFYVGNIPIFYLPYVKRAIGVPMNHFSVTPGYRSSYGSYLLGSYSWYWNEHLSGAIHVDYRSKHGIGLGPDIDYSLGDYGFGTFRYYYLKDQRPGTDFTGRAIDEDRQRVWFTHKVHLRTNLTAKAVIRYQSDARILRDFFEGEYDDNIQPSTFFELNQLSKNFSVNVLVQPRINDFFDTVERLPDLKLSAFRQQLWSTPLYYESESSFGYYQRKFGNDIFPHQEAYRGDTFHQIVLPKTFFGWLNFTPRMGGRLTHYGQSGEDLTQTIRDRNRNVFNTGAELSFKASRLWPNATSSIFEVDGLRHILMPSVNYVYVPRPSVAPPKLPQFDYELPTLRLLPIEFPDYNAIDSIDSQNVLRFTLVNKLQTKRDGAVDNLVHWALYTDWRLKPREDWAALTPGGPIPTRKQSTFADLFSDLDLKPRSWLNLSSEMRYDMEDGHINEANHTVSILPRGRWTWTVGHRYLRPHYLLGRDGDHNLFVHSFYFRFNENWATRISHHFEARDGTLEEQYYTVYRDLRSWTAALTLRVRDHRNGPTDVAVAVTFSLKAFPRFKQGSDRDRPSYLLGS